MEDVTGYDDGDFNKSITVEDPIECIGAPVDDNYLVRLVDPLDLMLPIGSFYISIDPTDPGTIFGGTWAAVEGKFIAGYKAGDADFGTVSTSGGAKTHHHAIDVPNTTSSAPSAAVAVDANLDITTVNVATSNHTHDTDPASFNTASVSHLPPFYVAYIWLRTA
jgi:hypothetical protein